MNSRWQYARHSAAEERGRWIPPSTTPLSFDVAQDERSVGGPEHLTSGIGGRGEAREAMVVRLRCYAGVFS